MSPEQARGKAVDKRADVWSFGVLLWEMRLMDVARGVTSRLTNPPGLQFDAVWSPDGRSVVFAAEDGGKVEIRRKGLRASDPETVLVKPRKDTAGVFSENWSPDGKALLFLRLADKLKTAWALPLAGGEPVEVLHSADHMVGLQPAVGPQTLVN